MSSTSRERFFSRWQTLLGGKRSRSRIAPPWRAAERKDVLFLFDQTGAWTRYRCDHQAEALRSAGLSCDLVQTDGVDLLEAVEHYGCFVLNRVEWTDEVAAFLSLS